jgi:hypothetical protein
MNFTYVIYSHTEFLDLLQITCDYLTSVKNKILIINKNDLNHHLYSEFKDVIFYDDTLPYTDKVSDALKKINSKYILFSHEVDIPLKRDDVILNKFIELMELKSIDRIDLQPNGGNSGDFIQIVKHDNVENWPSVPSNETNPDEMYLGLHTDPNSYIYNVNPSIWKKDSLIEIFDKFKGRSYRDIEYGDVQNYCLKFKIYNLYSINNTLRCGYMNSLPLYKYLHITHYRRLLRFDGTWRCEFGWTYVDAADEYTEIVNKYNLKNCGRPFS